MTHLDGNTLAGPLADLLGGDPTSLVVECDGCRTPSAVAQLVVWSESDEVTIARCPHCVAVMLSLRAGVLDVRGVRTLRSGDAAS